MERIITETAQDRNNTILAIRGYSMRREQGRRRLAPFRPVSRDRVVADSHRYYVVGPDASRPLIPVRRISGATCSYLRSVADGTPVDNLAELDTFPWPLPRGFRRPPARPELRGLGGVGVA